MSDARRCEPKFGDLPVDAGAGGAGECGPRGEHGDSHAQCPGESAPAARSEAELPASDATTFRFTERPNGGKISRLVHTDQANDALNRMQARYEDQLEAQRRVIESERTRTRQMTTAHREAERHFIQLVGERDTLRGALRTLVAWSPLLSSPAYREARRQAKELLDG